MSKKIPQLVKEIKAFTPEEVDRRFQKTISYSQMSIYLSCPYKWKLQYKDGLSSPSNSVNLVFGTAMHETLQNYLTVMYETSTAEADRLDLDSDFHERFTNEYKKQYTNNSKTHFSSPEELKEFYEDGLNILQYFKKKKGEYFSKKGWHLVGCEIPILITPNSRYKCVLYKGFLDLVMYHEPTNTVKIIDLKTSTRGWDAETKKSEEKQFQLILYKEYLSQMFNISQDQIEVEFVILKRKIWEKSEFPQSRMQSFVPPSGKIKTKKATEAVNKFIDEVFELDGTYKEREFEKKPSKMNCRYCPYTEICDKNGSNILTS